MRVGRRALSTGVRVLLRKRPAANQPVTKRCFELREGGCGPAAAVCAAGQLSAADMLYCRTLYLSVDPFLRCRFNESTGVDYTQPCMPQRAQTPDQQTPSLAEPWTRSATHTCEPYLGQTSRASRSPPPA